VHDQRIEMRAFFVSKIFTTASAERAFAARP
jgi:hypothetical protein